MVLYLEPMKYAAWMAKFYLQGRAARCFTQMHLLFLIIPLLVKKSALSSFLSK